MKNMKNFIERWKNRGDEKSDTQKFWLEFLRDILKIERPTELIEFEKRVELSHKSFIDGYIPSTRTIIEQKSLDVKLDNAAKQSDGSYLTPFEQAKRYSDWLPDSERARWIVTCNFQEFHIHDMERPKAVPEIIRLEDLEDEYKKFDFLVNVNAKAPKEIREEKLSIKAGELVGKLKNSLWSRYKKDVSDFVLEKQKRSLTVFCVRIVFLLYAEDSGLFKKNQFHDYLNARKVMAAEALEKLFEILNIKEEDRENFYFNDELKNFPYVNGGLFEKGIVIIPNLDDEILKIILEEMSEGFDWSGINPTIFGAIFESVINDDERKQRGMHYTTSENIHKVIDPLFLDDLKIELENILAFSKGEERTQKLLAFQEKLSKLRFLDPACGSGNFLTESFISLRTLENKILRELPNPEIKVLIFQFYGIEADEFAVAVAQTALYIADNQMLNETEERAKKAPLPLKKYDNIKYGSAMEDLEGVAWGLGGWKILHDDMLYIMGNPPFLGYSQQNDGQKKDVKSFFGVAKVDYVTCWFARALEYLDDQTKAAFVATNSITQGEQVAIIFRELSKKIQIDFAYQSFVWSNEMQDKDKQAHVHCVIIGFSTDKTPRLKKLYTPEGLKLVENINFYLNPAPNIFIESRKTPICPDAPEMKGGNRPADGGHLIIDSQKEYEDFIKREPKAKKFIKRFVMGNEFINNIPRYCLWLVDATPEELSKMPLVMERITLCKQDRLKGAPDRQKLADTAWLFREQINPENYIAIPVVSSENRDYIPIGWLNDSIVPGNKLFIIPDSTLYHFGILTSRVHMAWMRTTAGRLKSDYSYSKTVVYNNFVWPAVNDKQRLKIESTAQKILDARSKYPESSFASLYNDNLMPIELRKAHKENDAAVCEAYGFNKNISEEEIVNELMKLYEKSVIK